MQHIFHLKANNNSDIPLFQGIKNKVLTEDLQKLISQMVEAKCYKMKIIACLQCFRLTY